jgi:ArsR family transcriptional regulator
MPFDDPIYVLKAGFFRVLGHPARVRILELLRDGERSVGDLQAALSLDSSGTSQHLAALKRHGLLESRRERTSVYYRVRDPRMFQLLEVARQILTSSPRTRSRCSQPERANTSEHQTESLDEPVATRSSDWLDARPRPLLRWRDHAGRGRRLHDRYLVDRYERQKRPPTLRTTAPMAAPAAGAPPPASSPRSSREALSRAGQAAPSVRMSSRV